MLIGLYTTVTYCGFPPRGGAREWWYLAWPAIHGVVSRVPDSLLTVRESGMRETTHGVGEYLTEHWISLRCFPDLSPGHRKNFKLS